MTAASPLLAAEQVSVSFGATSVIDDVSLAVDTGELVALIGPNGAGKTTLFEAITGFIPLTSGLIRFAGQDVTRQPPHRRARAGLGRSFQDAGLFSAMRVDEVLQVALERHVAPATDTLADLFKLPCSRRAERWSYRKAEDVMERFGLLAYRDLSVGELSTGMRRILELSCVIAMRPRMLLLDEPTAGIAQAETEAMTELISTIRAETGVTTLLIEHDIPMVMRLAERIYVLEAGRLIAEGSPKEIARNARVIEAYLGRDFEHGLATEEETARA